MKIEDEKRLEEKDLREKRKKQRFDIRYEMEHNWQLQGIVDFEKNKAQSINRVNYRRYVEHLDRGFDILTNSKFDTANGGSGGSTFYKPQVSEKPKVWDIIESQKVIPMSAPEYVPETEQVPAAEPEKIQEPEKENKVSAPIPQAKNEPAPQRESSHHSQKPESKRAQKSVLSNVKSRCIAFKIGWS